MVLSPSNRSLDPVSHGGIRLRRATSSVVGRSQEIAALDEALSEASGHITALSLEGEPGIGKSRLLLTAADIATARGFATVAVSGDEEIRGPFLVAREIFSADELREGGAERTTAALDRAGEILAGRDDPAFDGLSSTDRALRVIDQATLALRACALGRPIAILLDDLQWADQDSLRLLRYLVRTQPGLPVFIAMALRPEEGALTTELVTLLADMDRMGVVRRMRVGRFHLAETADMLRQTLGGPVTPATVAMIQAQAEGVPFVIEELLRAYRDAGLLQSVDGSWSLSPRAGRLVPSSVRTLVQRRAAHLPDDARTALAEAAVLGRTFRVADVCAIRRELGEAGCDPAALREVFAPALEAGLILPADERTGADFTFGHEQVQAFATSWLQPARRRAIHAAIVELLAGDGEPPAAALASLARHALAAEDVERSAQFSVAAAEAALKSNAADEALRLIEDALAVVSARADRVALLRLRDDAYNAQRRSEDRLEGLTELAALADAANDAALEREVLLRRASALRNDDQPDRASLLAKNVRLRAAADGDLRMELAACLELGQALMRSALGEAFAPTPFESDFEAAEEPFARAAAIAEEIGDTAALAAATRELGVVSIARVRAWFVEQIQAGGSDDILRHVAAGGSLEEVLVTLPIMGDYHAGLTHLQRSLELFDSLGDRRGAMSVVIAMAYLAWAADVHVGASPARRIEEIRRLASSMQSLSRESGRAAAEVQMLYGVHVFCRSKVIPDLAITRGREAYEQARELGERSLEFLSAGGTALAALEIGDVVDSRQWLDRAAQVASSVPTAYRSRQVELWRGLVAAGAGDVLGLEDHLDRALGMSSGLDRRAARCEILAAYALECARLGIDASDERLLARAGDLAREARALAAELPGRPPWAPQADAAEAVALWHQGERRRAAELAKRALAYRSEALREDPHLEILVPAARVLFACGEEAELIAAARDELQVLGGLISQRTADPEIRARWWAAPTGRALAELVEVPVRAVEAPAAGAERPADAAADERLLSLLVEGRTDAEIAEVMGITPERVAQLLSALYTRMGARTRVDATVLALTGQL